MPASTTMATLRELFDGEFGYLGKSRHEITAGNPPTLKAIEAVYSGLAENMKFLVYYVAEEYATADLSGLLQQYADSIARCDRIRMLSTTPGVFEADALSTAQVLFTGRVLLYIDATLDDATKQGLASLGGALGLRIQIRDRKYAKYMTDFERPVGFISHDSRDKDTFVRPLAEALRGALCPVFYDEFSINPGDSLTESIDRGLRESRKCVVVLSSNYFENASWARGEFKAIVTRHMSSDQKFLIPVWHGVTAEQVAQYSPLIADIVAIDTTLGIEEVSGRLQRLLLAEE